jgi:hypothetical protein
MSASLDERLARGLDALAALAEPTDTAWEDVIRRGVAIRRRARRRRAAALVAAAAVIVGMLVVAASLPWTEHDDTITVGTPPALDPETVELARLSIVAAAALADESRASLIEPARLAEAAEATDRALDAWRPRADSLTAHGTRARDEFERAMSGIRALPTVRLSRVHVSPDHMSRAYAGLDTILDVTRVRVGDAGTVYGARQLADATFVARLAIETPERVAEILPTWQGMRDWTAYSIDRPVRLADGVSPARRPALRALLGDRRLIDALASRLADRDAGRAATVPDDRLATLAEEHQDRLVTQALGILAAPPAVAVTGDAAARHELARAGVRLRTARDAELWSTLVGDAGQRAAARARVDDALDRARRARTAVAVDASLVRRVDDAAAVVADVRQRLDAGMTTAIAGAGELASVNDIEAELLEAAYDLDPAGTWDHSAAVVALGEYSSVLTHAGALALLRLDDVPPGGGDVDRLQGLWANQADVQERFARHASADQLARLRAISPGWTANLISWVLAGKPSRPDREPRPSDADRARTELDRLEAFVVELAG